MAIDVETYGAAVGYTKKAIKDVQGFSTEVVEELPTTDIKTNVLYFVPKSGESESDIYDEYINTDGTSAGWEKIGSTEIDLSDYATKEEVEVVDHKAELTGLKNFYENTDIFPKITNGVTFTSGGNGIIIANGTASGTNGVSYYLSGTSHLPDDNLTKLTVTGCPENGSEDTYCLKVRYLWRITGESWHYEDIYDIGNGVTITRKECDIDRVSFTIIIKAGVTVDNLIFKPMIRDFIDLDDTFKAYCKNNVELTENSNLISAILDVNNQNNLLKYPYYDSKFNTSGDYGSITVNNEGRVSINVNNTGEEDFILDFINPNSALRLNEKYTYTVCIKYSGSVGYRPSASTYFSSVTYIDNAYNTITVYDYDYVDSIITIPNPNIITKIQFVLKPGKSLRDIFGPYLSIKGAISTWTPYAGVGNDNYKQILDLQETIKTINNKIYKFYFGSISQDISDEGDYLICRGNSNNNPALTNGWYRFTGSICIKYTGFDPTDSIYFRLTDSNGNDLFGRILQDCYMWENGIINISFNEVIYLNQISFPINDIYLQLTAYYHGGTRTGSSIINYGNTDLRFEYLGNNVVE